MLSSGSDSRAAVSQAEQLKVSGEATPSQVKDVRAQLDVIAAKQRCEEIDKEGVMPPRPRSSACVIM